MTPATATPEVRRPTYREGSLLKVAELRAEQQSRSEALARHARDVHTPGAATGLEVTVAAGGAGVQIQPGLAVDGAGRYLGLQTPVTKALAKGDDVTVSIIWRAGSSQIELSAAAPPAVADRTEDAWPVVLGRARRSATGTGKVTVDPGPREELELRAASVTDPAGGSRVVLGGQSGRTTQVLGVQLSDDGVHFDDVTTADADGTAHISVDTTVSGEVRVRPPVVLDAPIPTPSAAVPWSLYRTTFTRDDKTVADQVRLEVGEVASGANPHALRAVVGKREPGRVRSLLRVEANGTVRIPGQLIVEGFTTVTGSSGSAAGTTTLSGLAAQEADLLARAQVLLNQLTDKDLQAKSPTVPAVSGTSVTYTLQLVSSAATAVHGVAAYETVVVGSNIFSQQFVAQGVDLPPGTTHSIPRTINVGTSGATVIVTVLAIGVGQDGQPRAATLRIQAHT